MSSSHSLRCFQREQAIQDENRLLCLDKFSARYSIRHQKSAHQKLEVVPQQTSPKQLYLALVLNDLSNLDKYLNEFYLFGLSTRDAGKTTSRV